MLEAAIDRSKIKIGGMIGTTLLFFGVAGYVLRFIVVGNASLGQVVVFALMIFLAFAAFALQVLFIKSGTALKGAACIEGACFAVFALQQFVGVSIIMIMASGLLALIAARSGQEIAAGMLRVEVEKVVRTTTKYLTTIVALIASTLYVGTAISGDLHMTDSAIYALVKPAEPIVAGFFPGFAVDSSIGSIVRDIVSSKLGAELSQLPAREREAALEQLEAQTISSLRDAMGIAIRANDRVVEIMRRLVNAQTEKIPESWRGAIRVGIGVLVFLIVKGFGFIAEYGAIVLAWIFNAALFAVGFTHKISENVTKETAVI